MICFLLLLFQDDNPYFIEIQTHTQVYTTVSKYKIKHQTCLNVAQQMCRFYSPILTQIYVFFSKSSNEYIISAILCFPKNSINGSKKKYVQRNSDLWTTLLSPRRKCFYAHRYGRYKMENMQFYFRYISFLLLKFAYKVYYY